METRTCPECGKKMIKRYEGRVIATYPPRYPWYFWCRCGKTLPGSEDKAQTMDGYYQRRWEEVNAGT